MATTPGTRRRLSAADRRTHLLDVAVALLGESGPEAVTMEGVAARAGVSKALGYRYFDNADELLLAVHDREVAVLTAQVRAALRAAPTFEAGIRASLTAWLDRLAERGAVITMIMQVGPVSGPVRERSRQMHATFSEFYGHRAAETYGIDVRTATAAASILLTGLDGLIDCWINRRMPRRELVDIYTTMCAGAFEALAAEPPLIGGPIAARTRSQGRVP